MRILVTLLLVFVTAALAVACKPFHGRSATQDQIAEGDRALGEATTIEKSLDGYHLSLIASNPNQDYNWQKRTKAERREMKEKLARYLSLTNAVLALDARKGLYVTRKDEILAKRDAATLKQKSLENFERIFGENYEPSRDAATQPDYIPARNI